MRAASLAPARGSGSVRAARAATPPLSRALRAGALAPRGCPGRAEGGGTGGRPFPPCRSRPPCAVPCSLSGGGGTSPRSRGKVRTVPVLRAPPGRGLQLSARRQPCAPAGLSAGPAPQNRTSALAAPQAAGVGRFGTRTNCLIHTCKRLRKLHNGVSSHNDFCSGFPSSSLCQVAWGSKECSGTRRSWGSGHGEKVRGGQRSGGEEPVGGWEALCVTERPGTKSHGSAGALRVKWELIANSEWKHLL